MRLLLIAILASTTTLSIPYLSAQPLSQDSPAWSQVSDGKFLLQQGIASYQQGNYHQALEIWLQALPLLETNQDTLNQALVLSNLSLAYQHLGKLVVAENQVNQSLNILKTFPSVTNSLVYTEIFAKALNTQACLQWNQGKLETALETWQQAAIYYNQAGNKQGVVGSSINEAQALQALGLHLQAEEKLQEIYVQLEQPSDPYLQVTGLLNLGKTLRRLGKLGGGKNSQSSPGSLEILEKSLAVAQTLKNPTLTISTWLELGNTQRALANQAINIQEKESAQQYYQRALTFYQQAAQVSSPLRLKAQINWLSLLVETGEKQQLPKLINSIQNQITTLPTSHAGILEQLNFARTLTCLQAPPQTNSPWCQSNKLISGSGEQGEQGEKSSNHEKLVSWVKIAQIIARAGKQAQDLQDIPAQSYAFGQLGGLYELQEQWEDAQSLTQQAIATIEHLQIPYLLYRWEWQLGRVLEKQNHIQEATAAYQAAVSTLGSTNTNQIYTNWDLLFSFQENVEPLYRNLINLLLPQESIKAPNQLNLQAARDSVQLLQRAELESFLRCSLQDIKTKQVEQLVDHPNSTAAVIYPIVLAKRLAIILKLPNSPHLKTYSSPIAIVDLEKILVQLENDLIFAGKKKAVQKNSQILYQLLIKPLENDLKANQINTLVFLLDAPLRNIPMSVLYDGQQYLIEKYAVAVTSGLELLESQALTKGDFRAALAGLSQSRRDSSPLPHVVTQLEQIQSEIASEVILDQEFTVEGLQNLLNSLPFPVVHIATHGQFSSQPEETFLVAWDKDIGVNDLRNLLRNRAQTRAEPVELLVLAACETSRGDKRAALGLAGIAVNSGARSTLATLWKIIADESPGMLLSEFYRQLRDNPQITKAEALRHAQLEFIQDRNRNAPYYWAPYVLIGNWL